MYIAEAIEMAKSLRPNEYSIPEILKWCDELSADIKLNYDPDYSMLEGCGSEILQLPQNVTINDITKVIVNERELMPETLNDFGIEYKYDEKGRVLKLRSSDAVNYKVIYITPYEPIRYINETIDITFDTSNNKKYFKLANNKDINIWVGDTLSITISNNTYSVKIDAIESVNNSIRYYYICSSAISSGSVTGAKVYREIQDKTPVPAPYDTMYIDFIVMKAALFSGKQDIYNSFGAQVANKLQDYQLYLKRGLPKNRTQFRHWL